MGPYEINPLKITKWAISRIQNGPFAQNLDFSRGPQLFWPQNGPRYRSCHLRGQKSIRPLEKSRFCAQGPFKILEMAHLVIFKGWFHNVPPHLQHRYINSYNKFFKRVLCVSILYGKKLRHRSLKQAVHVQCSSVESALFITAKCLRTFCHIFTGKHPYTNIQCIHMSLCLQNPVFVLALLA